EIYAVHPRAVILVGAVDPYAGATLDEHLSPRCPTMSICPPEVWDPPGLAAAAAQPLPGLRLLLDNLEAEEVHYGTYESSAPAGVEWAAAQLVQRDARCVWHPYTPL